MNIVSLGSQGMTVSAQGLGCMGMSTLTGFDPMLWYEGTWASKAASSCHDCPTPSQRPGACLILDIATPGMTGPELEHA